LIRVGIVATNTAIRVGLRELINNQSELNVVSASINLDELTTKDIDVLVVVPPTNVHQLTNSLAVLYLTDDPADVQELFKQGFFVWGAISLNSNELEISIAIQALAEGFWIGAPNLVQKWFPNKMAKVLSEIESPNPPLTIRETEVLQLAAQGLANKQIANQLGISEHTIKFHLSTIYTKLGASNRTEAVRSGIRYGLIVL